jgi:hypothetical protein
VGAILEQAKQRYVQQAERLRGSKQLTVCIFEFLL